MRTRDTALLRSVFDSSLRLDSARQDLIRLTPDDGFIHAIAPSKAGANNERIWDREIHVAGPIAHRWAKYDLHGIRTTAAGESPGRGRVGRSRTTIARGGDE